VVPLCLGGVESVEHLVIVCHFPQRPTIQLG
jgi:hypothetical protein